MTDTVTPAAPSAARVSAPSFLNGMARVFDLSLGEMLWSRRTVFMAIVLGAPVLLALVVRIVDASGIAPLRVNGSRVGGGTMFGVMFWWLYLRFVVPVLGVRAGPMLGTMVGVLVALLLVEGVTALREHSREDER